MKLLIPGRTLFTSLSWTLLAKWVAFVKPNASVSNYIVFPLIMRGKNGSSWHFISRHILGSGKNYRVTLNQEYWFYSTVVKWYV